MIEELDRKPLIRVVDDDEAIRESLRAVLEVEGYEVKVWSDAVTFFKEDAPSVPGCVLLDIMMPSITGIETQKEMLRRAYRLPIIFISAYGDIESVVSTMKLGAFDFLPKPLDPEKVLKSVRAALARESIERKLEASPETVARRFEQLTDRESEIVEKAGEGLTNTGIARALGISRRTVENHRASAYKKLQVNSQEGLDSALEALQMIRSEIARNG